MDSSQTKQPPVKDLTIENITENVHIVNSSNPDQRMKFVLERLVTHLHDFARETRLSTQEWMAGIQFLTAVGQICTDVRQEFILLSDILGLSLLVDSIDHPKPKGATEGTVLGPFHTHEAPDVEAGSLISQDPEGEPLLVVCTVKDTRGNPLEGVSVDVWETDSTGHYDVQHADRTGPDGRAILRSDKEGCFWFKGIVPVPYPIPHDGPVGQLLLKLKRHPMRPSHMHFLFKKQGYEDLITALYRRGDPYETTDAVFGVKDSLVVDISETREEHHEKYGVAPGTKLMVYDFVLVADEESSRLRAHEAEAAMQKMGMKMQFVNGLPVPEVD